jgi:hypothetical protein
LNQPLLMLRAVALALRARLRELRSLREICLIAQPPLLIQGGEYRVPTVFLIHSHLLRIHDGIRPNLLDAFNNDSFAWLEPFFNDP